MRCRFKRIEDFDRFHLVRKRSKEERYRIFVAPIPSKEPIFTRSPVYSSTSRFSAFASDSPRFTPAWKRSKLQSSGLTHQHKDCAHDHVNEPFDMPAKGSQMRVALSLA